MKIKFRYKVSFCLLALASSLLAQTDNARIVGLITDASGAVLPGVTVTATQTDTGVGRTTVTDDNGLYVLQAQAGRLGIVGKVDHLATGESLYAARFVGDRAFLVTFEQVDPLWSIDLSDPHAPRQYRVDGVVRNLDAWYAAFGVGAGDKLYVAPKDRVRIW